MSNAACPRNTPDNFEFDVFLSHNSADKRVVRRLAELLKQAGFTVWLDEWNIAYGDLIPVKVQDGIERSRVLMLCISSKALESGWVTLEHATAIHRDPANRQRRFIPIQIDDCTIPDALRVYRYVDYRAEDSAALEEVITALNGPDAEITLPPSRPKYSIDVLLAMLAALAGIAVVLIGWFGLVPQFGFREALCKWQVGLPALATGLPLLAYLATSVDQLGRFTLIRTIRRLMSVLDSRRATFWVRIGCLFVALAGGSYFVWLARLPKTQGFLNLIDGDLTSSEIKRGEIMGGHPATRIVWLAAQAELEMKRRDSSSNDLTEIVALQRELPEFDQPFMPIWRRYLARLSLGRVAYCRTDPNSMERHLRAASGIGERFGEGYRAAPIIILAQGLFALSQNAKKKEDSDSLLSRAKSVALSETSVPTQRLLGAIYYDSGEFGDAYSTWEALLSRTDMDEARGMEVPDAIERKRLWNNMALARLKQHRPNDALATTVKGLEEPWNPSIDEHRTQHVRLLATKTLCLLGLGRPKDALEVFEERSGTSVQIKEEGLSSGSALLKAQIYSALWRVRPVNPDEKEMLARNVLRYLVIAQDPDLDPDSFSDRTEGAFEHLVQEVSSRWKWQGIEFDAEGCLQAIRSLLLENDSPDAAGN